MKNDASSLLIVAPGREFVLPYIERELPKAAITMLSPDELATGDVSPEAAVMLSGTEVYAPTEGRMLDESTPVDAAHPLAKAEEVFTAFCKRKGLRPIILRCTNTVGTGMTGYMQQLVRSIYRGTFFHFAGNEAVLSTVHAAQIAANISSLLRHEGPLPSPINITDGAEHTLTDVANALAHRMNGKHISTLSTFGQKWLGRMLYGAERYGTYTRSLTFASTADLNLGTIDTVDYLRTHIYDENSL